METTDVLAAAAADASVRPAARADLAAIGHVHERAWTAGYRDLLPPEVLAELSPQLLAQAWQGPLEAAGRRSHHLLVACTGPTVVGFASSSPEQGAADAGAQAVADLPALLVDPLHQRRGHGSRLLSAVVAALREDGVDELRVWVPEPDTARQDFLRGAGLRPDGSHRTVATGDVAVRELRMVAGLGAG